MISPAGKGIGRLRYLKDTLARDEARIDGIVPQKIYEG